MNGAVLTVNGGSSSIKFALYDADAFSEPSVAGELERIGTAEARLKIKPIGSIPAESGLVAAADHAEGVLRVVEWLDRHASIKDIAAIGHRIVHGGEQYRQTARVTPEMVAELKRLVPMDPTHLPGEVALIEAFDRHLPQVWQVACFDTAFHRDLPPVAWRLPIPRRYAAAGVRRYGFHGLSFTFLVQELERLDARPAGGRAILAHLGAGASMAAVREGRCIDTTMSFTPAAGLVMATRSGDIDSGVLTYLMRTEKLDADGLDHLLNYQSGLLGLSETSGDMRDLLARRREDPRAAEAVDSFCYQARKWIGALAAALGGLDVLVFSGGIGENSPEVRAEICAGLEHLGLLLDSRRNAADEPLISAEQSRVSVRVIPTNEQAVIVGEVRQLLARD